MYKGEPGGRYGPTGTGGSRGPDGPTGQPQPPGPGDVPSGFTKSLYTLLSSSNTLLIQVIQQKFPLRCRFNMSVAM